MRPSPTRPQARSRAPAEWTTAFALKLARKDLGLALDAAGEAGIDLALAGAAHGRFGQAIDRGYGDQDSAATYRVAARS